MRIMKPSINLNGTPKSSMVYDRMEIINHLQDAITAMGRVNPHLRDYLGDTEQYNADRKLHVERVKILEDMISELTSEGVAINEQ